MFNKIKGKKKTIQHNYYLPNLRAVILRHLGMVSVSPTRISKERLENIVITNNPN